MPLFLSNGWISGLSSRFEPNDPNDPITTTIWLPLVQSTHEIISGDESTWFTAGANAQRTSWVPQGVDPDAFNNFGVEWYRPIEAYIGQNVQLIAARNKIFVSTSKGLYALDAATGDIAWRFDTELPLGHSPSVHDNMIFVGGFDRQVYALDADNGKLIWKFQGAKAGFSTNPLVVEGKVLMGSRDGYFYAIDEKTGNLLWQYPSSHQSPLAPILYSAAYKDGNVFFAANDNYAYALRVADGSLKWRSAKLPGDGYQAWWPVIFNDYVVYSSALSYADEGYPGTSSVSAITNTLDPYYELMHSFQWGDDFVKTLQRDDVFHQNEQTGSLLGPGFIIGSSNDRSGISWNWENGSTIVDASKVTEYLEDNGEVAVNSPTNKPWRRSVIVLNAKNGSEFTYDSDQDGYPEYAPFMFTGTKSGNRYPPLVIPTKNNQGKYSDVLYSQNLYELQTGWGISRARLNGWQMGTQYVYPIGGDFAIDEPFAQSAAGSILYENLCCDRNGIWHNLESETQGYLWPTLESIKLDWNEIEPWMRSQTPGYDQMWWGASMYDYYPRLYGNYGTINGIYHNHGLQNPIIPYQNRLFVHRSNAIIAYGSNPQAIRQLQQFETPGEYEQNISQEYPHVYRPLLEINSPDLATSPTLTAQDIQTLLDQEITKMLQVGHLRPGYFNSSRGLKQFSNYYENPGDSLYILSQAYHYISESIKADLRFYIQQHYKKYFEGEMDARTGFWIKDPIAYSLQDIDAFGQLNAREWMDVPPEVAMDMQQQTESYWVGVDWSWEYPQQNFYAIWFYANTFFKNDPAKLNDIYQTAKTRLEIIPPDNSTLVDSPWIHNGFISGYVGFLKLQELSGNSEIDSSLRKIIQNELNTLLALRANDFRKDSPWNLDNICCDPNLNKRRFNIARNFLYLTPELATYLRLNAYTKVTEAIQEYDSVAPYWMVTRYEASFGEFATDSLYTNHAMFQAKAQIMQDSTEDLLKYIDVPAFRYGDLFYIQNLISILESLQ